MTRVVVRESTTSPCADELSVRTGYSSLKKGGELFRKSQLNKPNPFSTTKCLHYSTRMGVCEYNLSEAITADDA